MQSNSASITLITGPMFAGKTTELLRIIETYNAQNIPTIMIKFKQDLRYSDQFVISHNGKRHIAVSADNLEEIQAIITEKQPKAIFVDEGQFFNDLSQFCCKNAELGINVYVSALNGDFKQCPFNNVANLFALCDHIVKLNAYCYHCGGSAPFSKRICSDTQVQLIGGSDMYRSACRKCSL